MLLSNVRKNGQKGVLQSPDGSQNTAHTPEMQEYILNNIIPEIN